MKRIKKILKSRISIFVITALLFGTIGASAATYFPSNDVTYDNSESGLKSMNVQEAIDELYTACKKEPTAGDSILDNTDIVTSGDGLYEDEYEDGKYTYKGASPNNYITFNNETAGWRIISINSDGTIKIMRMTNINTSNNISWNISNSNNWAMPATLNTYLNETYYISLTNEAQNQIVSATYNIGAVTAYNNDLTDQINDENSTKWKGKIALITASEYIRSNSNQSSCGTMSKINSNFSICPSTTWIFPKDYVDWWTLSPDAGYIRNVHHVNPGYRNFGSGNVNENYLVILPVTTLSSDIKITGGTGTQSDPFQIQ